MLSVLRYWIPLSIVITAFCGLTYLTVQQNYRQSANDPQIQMSEDIASTLESGKEVASVIPGNAVDLSKSLAPFIIVFNDAGQPISSNASLVGRIPVPPKGVFTYTKDHGQDRFTWQPRDGVRIAAVVTSYKQGSGFVLAGRSLREVEKRSYQLLVHVGVVWAVTILSSLLSIIIFVKLHKKP